MMPLFTEAQTIESGSSDTTNSTITNTLVTEFQKVAEHGKLTLECKNTKVRKTQI